MSKFEEFPKIARLSREVICTEKIDGTNAQVFIEDLTGGNFRDIPGDEVVYGPNRWDPPGICIYHQDRPYAISAGSRTRWVTPEQDNYGWARWVYAHARELLVGLGPGHHYGEWWGSGVNRGYGLQKGEKRFSLFNTKRWQDKALGDREVAWKNEERTQVPQCCTVVPIIAVGELCDQTINAALDGLKEEGSFASRGFMRPEGVVIYHTAAGVYFKKTLERDEIPKGTANVG